MSNLIDRQAAIDAINELHDKPNAWLDLAVDVLENLPSAQSEKTEYIPETKAVRSKRDCVDLSERVSATFYDQEHEEWTQKIVTIADVLDSVCDKYTILPSEQPEPQWIPCSERYPEQDECVLVTTGYSYFVWDCMPNRGDNYFWEDENGFYKNKYEVIAWMPIPKQKKDGNE